MSKSEVEGRRKVDGGKLRAVVITTNRARMLARCTSEHPQPSLPAAHWCPCSFRATVLQVNGRRAAPPPPGVAIFLHSTGHEAVQSSAPCLTAEASHKANAAQRPASGCRTAVAG